VGETDIDYLLFIPSLHALHAGDIHIKIGSYGSYHCDVWPFTVRKPGSFRVIEHTVLRKVLTHAMK